MKIIILGKGYVGSALIECLSASHDDVTLLSKNDVDYTNNSVLMKYLSDHFCKDMWVINTSGYTGRPNVDACEDNKDDTWYYNVTVPVNIASVCEQSGANYIHVSSGCIYDGYSKKFTEIDEPNFGILSDESSWYSKTKHAAELSLLKTAAHIFRIRMPFCSTWSERNVLTKLYKYDNVINCTNSLTNLEDFCSFILYYINSTLVKPGVYNVVNPGALPTSEILYMLTKHGIINPLWNQITLDELYKTTKAKRSNCVLSDEKIESMNLQLPDTLSSLDRCCRSMRTTKHLYDH